MALFIKKEPESNWRFEMKYRLTYPQYYRLRNALAPYMEPDPFTRPGGHYLVRSLYFDTFDFQAYHEKIEGDFGRIKMRLRTYGEWPEENPPVRVELKTRRGEVMEKYSTFISVPSCQAFLDTWHWPRGEWEGNPVLMEFERLLHLRNLRPKILVQYRREGFCCRDRDDLRITFDRDVCSTSASSLFPGPKVFWRPQSPTTVVFEIKCRIKTPPWLTGIIKRHSLKYVANSKYTQGIEIARPDVIRPAWNAGHLVERRREFLGKPARELPAGRTWRSM